LSLQYQSKVRSRVRNMDRLTHRKEFNNEG
jgi:hypothetical protein